MSKQKILDKEKITINWHEKSDMVSILTRHGLIRVFPERKNGSCTVITINTDKSKIVHQERTNLEGEDVLNIETAGYTNVGDYWK